MGLSTVLFVMALLHSGAASMKSQAYFNKTGNLPCHFTNSDNISLDELVVFWQNQDKRVLYELFKGKENPENVDPEYKGRTSLDQDTWTLQLHNVQIKDQGLYQCYVHHRKQLQGMISIHQMSTALSVLANFSEPEIMLISNGTENSGVINLTCSSVQGYPQPNEMYFLLKNTNSTVKRGTGMKTFQDNITELYNVSISTSVSVSSETNVSVFCVLQPGPTQTQLLSQPFNIDTQSSEPLRPDPDKMHMTAILLVSILVFLGLILMLYQTVKKKKKKQLGPSHECEAINVEEQENEQANERVENRVSEKSDEAQCVVNILKTDSGDKSATHF